MKITIEAFVRLQEWTGQITPPKHSQAVKVARPLPRVLGAS